MKPMTTETKTDDVQRLDVEHSSNVLSIAYWLSAGKLQVAFKGGKTYEAEGVSLDTWNKFSIAESKGSYFASELKKRYTWRKLEEKK